MIFSQMYSIDTTKLPHIWANSWGNYKKKNDSLTDGLPSWSHCVASVDTWSNALLILLVELQILPPPSPPTRRISNRTTAFQVQRWKATRYTHNGIGQEILRHLIHSLWEGVSGAHHKTHKEADEAKTRLVEVRFVPSRQQKTKTRRDSC